MLPFALRPTAFIPEGDQASKPRVASPRATLGKAQLNDIQPRSGCGPIDQQNGKRFGSGVAAYLVEAKLQRPTACLIGQLRVGELFIYSYIVYDSISKPKSSFTFSASSFAWHLLHFVPWILFDKFLWLNFLPCLN